MRSIVQVKTASDAASSLGAMAQQRGRQRTGRGGRVLRRGRAGLRRAWRGRADGCVRTVKMLAHLDPRCWQEHEQQK